MMIKTPESRYVTGAPEGQPAVGQQVQIKQHAGLIGPEELHLLGTKGMVLGYSKPHGYAVVLTPDGGEVLVHPETLQCLPISDVLGA